MRDAGLSIKTWMDINDNDYTVCKEVLEAYLGWVGKVQQKNDPNGIDVHSSFLSEALSLNYDFVVPTLGH